MSKPLIILGAGGHASVLLEELARLGRVVEAVSAPDAHLLTQRQRKIKRLSSDDEIFSYSPDEVRLVNGIAAQPGVSLARSLHERFSSRGYVFETIISVGATVSPSAVLSTGVQVLSGAIVNAKARIGRSSIVNTGAVVEHDCVVGDDNHIAPRATLCGGVRTGESVFIGAGSVVIQGINIGNRVIVGAGTTVVKKLADGCTVTSAKNIIR